MVLGASAGQLPLIHRAVELGCHVITVDYLPDNIGHRFSHQSVNCSTVDQQGVLGFARDLAINGIATFASDVATTTVAYVAGELGLAGCSAQVAQTMSNKARFRRFQHEHSLNAPDFVIGDDMETIEAEVPRLSLPLMFKPVDTSGSRGVTRLDAVDSEGCRNAFACAQRYSRSGVICVEEFVEGVDVSGDGFLVDGRLHAVVTQKYKQGYVPTGHSLPANLGQEEQQRVFAEVTRTCLSLGYMNGPVDFDVKISPTQVVVIEISPRLGGNGIPRLIGRATGVDLVKATVRHALGEQVALPARLEVTRPCGSWVIGSVRPGRIEAIAPAKRVEALVPEIFDYQFDYQVGDDVPAFEHSGNSLGAVLFDLPPETRYAEMVARIQSAMGLQIASSDAVQE
jgi:biotin carboxylase